MDQGQGVTLGHDSFRKVLLNRALGLFLIQIPGYRPNSAADLAINNSKDNTKSVFEVATFLNKHNNKNSKQHTVDEHRRRMKCAIEKR